MRFRILTSVECIFLGSIEHKSGATERLQNHRSSGRSDKRER